MSEAIGIKRKAPNDRSSFVAVKKLTINQAADDDSPANVPILTLPEAIPDLVKNTSSTNEAVAITPRKQSLMRKLAYARTSLSRARVALFRLHKKQQKNLPKVSLPAMESIRCRCQVCDDLNRLPPNRRQFFLNQIKASSCSKYGVRYCEQDKLLALVCSTNVSPPRFMKSSLQLPSERTLQSYVGGFSIGCGFKSEYFQALKKRT